MRYRGPSLIARIFQGRLACASYSGCHFSARPGVRLFAETARHGTFGRRLDPIYTILWQSEVRDSDLDRIIRNGVRGTTMPAFGEKLDASARQPLIRQIRTLTAHAIRPTTDHKPPLIEVSAGRLAAAGHDAQDWLMYGRDYGNQRFSPLAEINRSNVRNLPVWALGQRLLILLLTPFLLMVCFTSALRGTTLLPSMLAQELNFGTTSAVFRNSLKLAADRSIEVWPFSIACCTWRRSTRISSHSILAPADSSGMWKWERSKTI